MASRSLPPDYIESALNRGGNLMISISGIRGTIPEGLDPINIVLFARAFAAITGKKIVIGSDARATGPILKHLLVGTLLAAGKEVMDIGLAPTPTVKAAIKSWKADGGVMISASHNPPEWNAFKLIDKGGFFFNQKRSEELLATLRKDLFPAVDYRKMGSYHSANGIQTHIVSILDLIPNLNEIKKRKYRVVVDAVAGAGREALPELLRAMGCHVVPLFCDADPTGRFPRPPEPTPDALKRFGKLVKESRAAVGFALDPDADRLVTGTPGRGAVNEEYTLPLALLGMMEKKELSAFSEAMRNQGRPAGLAAGASGASKGQGKKSHGKKRTIVLNLSTARLVDHVAPYVNACVVRSKVGEANVVEEMVHQKAFFGGEGNGGVIHPGVPSYGRDSLIGAALILSAMTSLNCSSLDNLMDLLPHLHMKKTKQPLSGRSAGEVFKALRLRFPDATMDERDGLHLLLEEGAWIHARSSNTEPILRIILQAPTAGRLKELSSIVDKI